MERAKALHKQIEFVLGISCYFDGNIQDATHHAAIALPGKLLDSPAHAQIRLSNFGGLATIVNEGRVNISERQKLISVIEGFGYTYIPEKTFDVDEIRSLFIRLFDYL